MNDTNNFAADFVDALWKELNEDSAQKELERIRDSFQKAMQKQKAYDYLEGNRYRRFSAFARRVLIGSIVLFAGACVLVPLVG